MRALSAPKLLLALIGALPVFWLSGHIVEIIQPPSLPLLQGAAQWNDVAVWLAVFWCATLLSALAVGLVLALAARAVGYATIRAILTPSQAQWFGLLATALVWLAVTGLAWSDFSGKDRVIVIAWYLALGLFFDLFNVLWLLLGIRAAASVRQLRTAGMFFGAAFGTFTGALGLLTLLAMLLNGIDIQPTLPLFGLIYFIMISALVLPPALAVLGGAALCAGVLTARASRSDSSSGGDA